VGVPELSVVIATRNRSASLHRCLVRLSRQTQPAEDFEVIVVVDGSTDDTLQMLASLQTPYTLRMLTQPRSGQQAALNCGVAAARGRYCLFLDDDILPERGLVTAHLEHQRRGAAVGLGAMPAAVPPSADWFTRQFAEQWDAHYQAQASGTSPASWIDCYSGNLSVPRAAFLEVGGFAPDVEASFDLELGYRLWRHGLPVSFLPQAVGAHAEQKNGRQLLATLERHGRAAVDLTRRHPATLAPLLGGFLRTNRRARVLRRLLLALDVPPAWLALIGPVMGRAPSQRRWASSLAIYAFWRGVRRRVPDRATWRRLTHGTSILMYHAIGRPGERASRYVLPAGRFARQMAWLRWAGYRVIDLEELSRCYREGRLPPDRAVVITLDDGYRDNLELAAPTLRRFGWPATVFVVTGRIGAVNDWSDDPALVGRPLMSWADLHALTDAGLSVGAHTRTHPRLTRLTPEAARNEIAGSRADLERGLPRLSPVFAYPYGDHDEGVRTLAAEAGFAVGCGMQSRRNHPATPAHNLNRTEIRGTDSLARFALRVALGNSDVFRPREPVQEAP
jgi:peptidoglycan/xylan/chitin deacetylase (PgdA/CDA1 family)/GT2 family glycosyltransferase